MSTTTLKISGMTCGHCVEAVRTALAKVDGVEDARVDLEGGRAVVEYDAGRTSPRALANAVMDQGYMAEETG
ncbi:MAG: heavy-metal-associated domain-containing protein [Longimicrobiales bacterium]